MDIEQYKRLAFKNNTFEMKALEESLEESKMNAYQYLRQFQLESTGYKRFDFNMQDIYKTNKVNHTWTYVPRKWLFFIDYEFINVGKRLDYKRSELFEKDLNYDDIINNTSLFDSSFLVFINGELFTEGIEILCKEDKTYVIFICKEKPSDVGFKISDMKNYIETNAKVTILFIPNVGITNVITNAYRLKSNGAYKGLPYRIMNLSEIATYDENTLTYAKYNGEMVSRPINVEFGESGLFVDEESIQRSIDMDPDNTTMNIQLIPLRYLFKKININKGDQWFDLPIQDYPIATDNCLIFDTEGNFIHDARIRHYYPNVYHIENIDEIINEKELIVYVFYYFNKHSILKHKNMIDVYYKYMPDYLDRYREGLIPETLTNFEPPVVDYSIKDFQLFNLPGSHFVYKIEKMKEFMQADVNNFRRYLDKLQIHNNYYYIDIAKINLEERVRKDNSDTGLSPVKTFDEDRCMFVFRNDFKGMYDKLLIHVDGLRYETIELYQNGKYDFVYIPKDLLNEDSVIEIEKLTEVMKMYPFKGRSGLITIDIGDFAVRNKTLYNDLFIVDTETSQYVNPKKYRIVFPVDVDYHNDLSPDVLDFMKSKDGEVYYYLDINEETDEVKLIQHQDVTHDDATGYLRTKDTATDELYQLNIEGNHADYEPLPGDYEVTKYLNAYGDPNTKFIFRIEDGVVRLDIHEGEIEYVEDGQIVMPAEFELSDVFLRCHRKIKIIILDESLYNRQLELHIKKNFRIAKIEVQEETEELQPIEFSAVMKNDKRYVRVYRNGRLVPRHLTSVLFPPNYNVNKMRVYPGTFRNINDRITIELMPYMMKQVSYMETIPSDKVIDLTCKIDKPFDFRWYDVYVNGRKVPRKNIEIISAHKIKLLKSDSLRWLEIIENSRDKEYFGYKPTYDIIDELFYYDEEFAKRVNESINNLFDIEEPVIERPVSALDYLLKDFYLDYLIPNYGLINPDILQIDEYTIEYYKDLLTLYEDYFPLNPDKGKGEFIIPINPDMDKN